MRKIKIVKKINQGAFSRFFFPIQKKAECFLTDAHIKVLGVGARGDTWPLIQNLAPYASLYVCEPDEKETDAVRRDRLKPAIRKFGIFFFRSDIVVRDILSDTYLQKARLLSA
jgi:hypothetical protein